ncbi:MAG: HepT-like ribonuclease domain-containing protein [Alkalispirochaeta sp.]
MARDSMTVNPDSSEELMETVREALEPFDGIAFAFLFGSAVAGRLRADSDLDVAVYGVSGRAVEIEVERRLDGEMEMQLAVERATGRNVDLLVLNRAPAVVCAAAILTGNALFIRDGSVYSRYFLAVTGVAIDFLETEREWRDIRARSNSLSAIDRHRLERIIAFAVDELEDAALFGDVHLRAYQTDRSLRRNLDRWVENLTNAVIDIAKIVLASEGAQVPQTYAQILDVLPSVSGFTDLPGDIRHLAALRNVMAHEYLDLRFTRVQAFIRHDVAMVREVVAATGRYLLPGGPGPDEDMTGR